MCFVLVSFLVFLFCIFLISNFERNLSVRVKKKGGRSNFNIGPKTQKANNLGIHLVFPVGRLHKASHLKLHFLSSHVTKSDRANEGLSFSFSTGLLAASSLFPFYSTLDALLQLRYTFSNYKTSTKREGADKKLTHRLFACSAYATDYRLRQSIIMHTLLSSRRSQNDEKKLLLKQHFQSFNFHFVFNVFVIFLISSNFIS